MSNGEEFPHEWSLVQNVEALGKVIQRASEAATIGVDVEANGLFVYRPRLCTVQIAWEEGDRTIVAIVDTLSVDPAALAPLFDAPTPIKVLHDLAFDARMLHEHGAPLRHVRDTSVTARLLGYKSTGLAAVLTTELGIVLDKRFQQHDWSRRPLQPEHVRYLSNDVAYLMRLDRALIAKALELDIVSEIEAECSYKLSTAPLPPRDQRPGYVRVKGVQQLDRPGRAVLRHLVNAREAVAEQQDVPSFKIVTNDVLLDIARKRPMTMPELGRIRGALSGRAGRRSQLWLDAVALGIKEGDVPSADQEFFDPPPYDRRTVAQRRRFEAMISAFRRGEAKRRGVDEQVVLPGHCATEVVTLMMTSGPSDPELPQRIAAIAGLGAKRAERYADALAALRDAPESSDEDLGIEEEDS